MKGLRFLLPVLLGSLLSGPAGLAFVIQSSVSSADSRTRHVRWPQLPVDFVMDGGPLAGGDGYYTVADALDIWDGVPTAVRLGGELFVYEDQGVPVDFTADNLGLDYGLIGDGIQEIAFDETGDILAALGLDPETVLGVSLTVEDTGTQEIIDTLLVLNGTLPSSPQMDLLATTVHELGHVWGLGHTFIGAVNMANTEPGLVPIEPEFIPSMYPYTNPEDDRFGRSLEWDDMAGISTMYPETVDSFPDQIPFGHDTGTLAGLVTYRGEVPLTAVHVRAVNVDHPDTQIAGLSGFRGDGRGSFEIQGVPPGRYYLVTEAIDGRDGISAATIEDDGIGACTIDGFLDVITPLSYGVAAGGQTGGFDFRLDTLPLDDDDAVEIGLPAGFAFSLAGVPCERVFLYSNGYLGFHRYEDQDPEFTFPYGDLHQFLSRPFAAIAPLRCDLDPESNLAHRIEVSVGPGQVKFQFKDVLVGATKARATFDLTLMNGGGFRFDYGGTGGALPLVGYTAGVFASGGMEGITDLAALAGGSVPTAQNLVLYDLPAAGALDRSSLSFAKPATDPFPARSRLIYPWLSHNAFFTLGLAVVSNLNRPCQLRLTALDADGRPLPVRPGSANPATVTLEPFAQFVTQAGQLFSFADEAVDGWVLVECSEGDPYAIQGFFLAQSFWEGTMDSLDGAVASPDTARTVLFTRFAGEAGEFTDLTVVNPNPFVNEVTVHVYWEDGAENAETAVVNPNGAAYFQLTGEGSAFVVVDATEPVTGFAMNFNEAGSLAGQGARFLWESRDRMVSPHFIHLDGTYATRLDLVNPNDDASQVTIALYDAAGQPVGRPVQLNIGGWYNARVDITPVQFEFRSNGLVDGWVLVTAGRPVIGSMTFGDPDFALYQSTLPLLWQPLFWTLHSHLAQGLAGNVAYVTGLAALSLDPGNLVSVDLYDSAGNLLDGVDRNLGKNARSLGLLTEWLPDGPWPLTSGYLAGAASAGVYEYELFTTAAAEFFAAVPSQKYFPVQVEGDDFYNGWPEYAEPLEDFPVEVAGEMAADDAGYFLVDAGDGFVDEIEDLFSLRVSRQGWYVFSLYAANQYCDLDLFLFDDDWELIADSAYGAPGAEYIEVELAPGDYCVGVSLFDLGWFGEGQYFLVVEPDAVF